MMTLFNFKLSVFCHVVQKNNRKLWFFPRDELFLTFINVLPAGAAAPAVGHGQASCKRVAGAEPGRSRARSTDSVPGGAARLPAPECLAGVAHPWGCRGRAAAAPPGRHIGGGVGGSRARTGPARPRPPTQTTPH